MENATAGVGERERDKLFNFRPALFAAFFLLSGIGFAYARIVYAASWWWVLFLLPVAILPLLFSEGIQGGLLRLGTLAILFICFGVGFLSFRMQITAFQDARYILGEAVVLGEVENCKRNEEGVTLTLKNLYINEEECKGRLRVYLPVSAAQSVDVGEKTLVRGEIKTDTSLTGKHGFRGSEIGKKLYYTMTTEEECVRVGRASDPLLSVRGRMEQVVKAGMDETSAELTLALLTGDVTGVDGELMDNMRYGGISHLFAVSGLNVGALYGCCLFLFQKTFLKRTNKVLRFLSLAGILLFYSGICGFSASVVRAAITCAVCYAAKLLGVGKDMLNTLGVAAIIILLLSPVELLGVGFQLSFLACLGLFLLMKPTTHVFDEIGKAVKKRFPRKYTAEEERVLADGDNLPPSTGEKIWRGVRDVLSASIAAQVMTVPALLYHFGYLSGWTLLLNFIFVPLIDALFTLLLILTVVCCILPFAAGVLLYVPAVLWSALILLFEIVDFSSFGLENVQISLALCVCYYGGTLFLTDKLNISPRLRRWLAVAFWVCFAVGLHLYNL